MNECDQLWAIERINLYFIEIHFLTGRFWLRTQSINATL